MSEFNKVLILDFGSQYTQLIARRIRENHVYCEIHPFNISFKEIERFSPDAVVLSGGPSSVLEGGPKSSKKVLELNVPILGICYGLQLMMNFLGGKVEKGEKREFGFAKLKLDKDCKIFNNVTDENDVWMSHGDKVTKIPENFIKIAHTNNTEFAAIKHKKKDLFGVQFHPEVVHTEYGDQIIRNFLFKIAKLKPSWTMGKFIEESIKKIREKVQDKKVILGLSGGVDSSVVALLLYKAIGKQLIPVFVDNGLLRKNEVKQVKTVFEEAFDIDLVFVDASKKFINSLQGITDPEKKRKTVGKIFIDVFEKKAKDLQGIEFLAQGTLYPDVIESISFKGPSATIKSHHNVGGLPEKMNLKLIEPLRELFKDEVRELGKELGLPDVMVNRHPFPGPGLSIRILGEVTEERLNLLKEADYIVREEIRKVGLYKDIWQAFAVLLPIKSVGVMGDERTYENTIAVRMVDSVDGMTADWSKVPYDVLKIISNRIINEVKGINRVTYDISSKPPATIEWE